MAVQRPLNPKAVEAANEALWKDNPELARRKLTLGPEDTTYRKEWMKSYKESLATQPPPTSGGASPPNAPCQGCGKASKTGTLVVTVTRLQDGKPVAGANVRIAGPQSRTGSTSGAGQVTFSGLAPGQYTVTASKADHSTETTSATVAAGKTGKANLVLLANVDLGVKVVDKNMGTPIKDATVRITGPSTAQAKTDASGMVRFMGIATGDYRIDAVATEGYLAGTSNVTVREGSTLQTIALEPVSGLSGRVTESGNGKPIAGATVTLKLSAGLSQPGGAPRSTTTDANGNFDFGEVDGGNYELEATAAAYSPKKVSASVAAGTNQTVSIPLSRTDIRIRAANGASDPPKVVPINKSVQLKGVPAGGAAGTYQWSTTSGKITLANATAQTVTVNAGATFSAGLDAETVQLVFTPSSGSALPPVATQLTVIEVAFSKSNAQKYGYDDMDNAAGVNHHVSVKRNDTTVVTVTIKGGASGDVLRFTSDKKDVADATPPASPGQTFDLTINGKAQDKAASDIHARANDTAGPICATIVANVYKQKEIKATVAKVYDSTVAATTLTRANFDVEAAETAINDWYKALVATIDLKDHDAGGNAIDVRYDLNGNGVLDLEPGGITSKEEKAINDAFNPAGQKVVIVKDLAWMYFLRTAATAGDTVLKLKTAYSSYMKYIHVGNSYNLGTGANAENVTIKSITGTDVELTAALANNHATTDGLLYRLNGLSGNPIFVKESGLSEAQQRGVIGHENGHELLKLKDLSAPPNLLHHSAQSRTGTQLRFKGQPGHHVAGDENQWEKVPR